MIVWLKRSDVSCIRLVQNKALPGELADQFTRYDSQEYADRLVSSVVNLFEPLGQGKQSLAESLLEKT